ncbi:MAG: hypothetical protein HQL58_11180 [Magnetococcales bacterium]|nr:hypothetical protein [Magnetococcales bacterium]
MSTGVTHPLDQLRKRLQSSLAMEPQFEHAWSDSDKTKKVFARIRAQHESLGAAPNSPAVADEVAYFRRHGQPNGWRGLKYTCIGAGSPDASGWCLLSETGLLEKLLALVQSGTEPRLQIKCFRALLACYWRVPYSKVGKELKTGWKLLRYWLALQLPLIGDQLGVKTDWFDVLSKHVNLLHDNPCGRYGPRLINGDSSELNAVIDVLNISSDSWIHEEAILAQIRTGISWDDVEFNNKIPNLLSISTGNNTRISGSLKIRCVAMLTSRYACCQNSLERSDLRDKAVSVIGNPWLDRGLWAERVTDSQGQPDEKARKMVDGWLKRSLIKDFFELLSYDGVGDPKRLKYWTRFIPYIEDMWFGLGPYTKEQRSEEINKFKVRAKGRLFNISKTTRYNNAFIMKIGSYLAIEFGQKGNAFFLFQGDRILKELSCSLVSNGEVNSISVNLLKSNYYNDLMLHLYHGYNWEDRFDAEIYPVIGHIVDKNVMSLNELASKYSLHVVDHRSKDGNFWVYADDRIEVITDSLKRLGFQYKSGKGWWRGETKRDVTEDAHIQQYQYTTYGYTQQTAVSKPAVTNKNMTGLSLSELINKYSLHVDDRRLKGGSYWVRTDDQVGVVSDSLMRLGFQYRAGKGWWRE